MPVTNATVTRLVWSAVTVSILMTVVAFWLSYSHLHSIAGEHGVTSTARAWAWPAIVDLFIVVGEITLVLASLGAMNPAAGWSLTIGGTITSVTINVWGVGAIADPLTYVVAGIPPIASLISFGVIMRYLHVYLTRGRRDTPAPTPVTTVTRTPVTPPAPVTQTPAAIPRPVTTPKAIEATPDAGMLTTSQAASRLGVGSTAVRQAIRRGRLTPDHTSAHGHHLFHPATIDAYRTREQ